MFANLPEIAARASILLEAAAAALNALPRLDLTAFLAAHQALLASLARYVCNYPLAVVTFARVKNISGFPQWLAAAEAELGTPLMTALTAPLNHLDISAPGLTALRDAVPPSLWSLRDKVARCAASAVEAAATLRYRRRDCLALFRLVTLAAQFSGALAADLLKPHRRLVKSRKLRTMQAPPHLSKQDRWTGADALLFFLFNDTLIGAMVFTRTKDDGTVTPLKRSRHSGVGVAAPGMFDKRDKRKSLLSGHDHEGGELVYEAQVVIPLLGAEAIDEPDDPDRLGDNVIRIVAAAGWHLFVGASSPADKAEWIADMTSSAEELEHDLHHPYTLDASEAFSTVRRSVLGPEAKGVGR